MSNSKHAHYRIFFFSFYCMCFIWCYWLFNVRFSILMFGPVLGFGLISGLSPTYNPCRSFSCLHPDAGSPGRPVAAPQWCRHSTSPLAAHKVSSVQLGLVSVRQMSLYSPHLQGQKTLDNQQVFFCQNVPTFSFTSNLWEYVTQTTKSIRHFFLVFFSLRD